MWPSQVRDPDETGQCVGQLVEAVVGTGEVVRGAASRSVPRYDGEFGGELGEGAGRRVRWVRSRIRWYRLNGLSAGKQSSLLRDLVDNLTREFDRLSDTTYPFSWLRCSSHLSVDMQSNIALPVSFSL